jgi:hypothetical protein
VHQPTAATSQLVNGVVGTGEGHASRSAPTPADHVTIPRMTSGFGGFRGVRGVRQSLPGEVEVDFGAGPCLIQPWIRVLDLRPDAGLVPAAGPVDWAQLDSLPELLTVTWAGPDRGIVEALAARPNIQFLYWHDAAGDVDLRSTRLGTVRLDGAGLGCVRLPDTLTSLLLTRPPIGLEVEAHNDGRGLDLRLFQYGPDVVIPDGLRCASQLWLWVGGHVSAGVLVQLTDLTNLKMTFDKPPGVITEVAELGRHTGLHTLQLDNAYGLNPHALPDLPALRHLELNGIRRTTASAIGARFKDTPVSICVTGAKSQAWLAAHLDNPFRDWVDDSKPFGKAACTAYNRARKAADAIATDDPDRHVAAERILRGLVSDLSTINDTYGLIDTLNREHAGTVFNDLARHLHVPPDLAESWFDSDRRF